MVAENGCSFRDPPSANSWFSQVLCWFAQAGNIKSQIKSHPTKNSQRNLITEALHNMFNIFIIYRLGDNLFIIL